MPQATDVDLQRRDYGCGTAEEAVIAQPVSVAVDVVNREWQVVVYFIVVDVARTMGRVPAGLIDAVNFRPVCDDAISRIRPSLRISCVSNLRILHVIAPANEDACIERRTHFQPNRFIEQFRGERSEDAIDATKRLACKMSSSRSVTRASLPRSRVFWNGV